jgi:hypothetical protein
MTNPPPPRYKVVERGRRLEVIDTRTGRPASSHGARPATSKRQDDLLGIRSEAKGKPPLRSPAGLDDGNVFTTKHWYDDKAPRTIRLNYVTRRRLDTLRFGFAIVAAIGVALSVWWWPVFPILLMGLAAAPKSRRNLRAAATRFVDTLDQAA